MKNIKKITSICAVVTAAASLTSGVYASGANVVNVYAEETAEQADASAEASDKNVYDTKTITTKEDGENNSDADVSVTGERSTGSEVYQDAKETEKENNVISGGVSASEESGSSDSAGAVKKTGFVKEGKNWMYYDQGVISSSGPDIVHGTINGKEGWYYVEDGRAVLDHTGVDSNRHGWWYVKNGKVDFSYFGFAENRHGLWYLENGQVKFNRNDIMYTTVNGETAWWNIKGSKVVFDESVEPNRHGWWYVKDGKVDFSFKGFAKNGNGWWYLENGKVSFNKNDIILGRVNGKEAWWNIKGSKVVFNESVESNRHGWWYIKDGSVDFAYKGVAGNRHGTWSIENGKVDFNASGWKKHGGRSYYFKNGKAVTGLCKVGSDYYLFDEKGGAQPNYKTVDRFTKYETDANGKVISVDHEVKVYINQLKTYGCYPMACAAAASIMALHADGYALGLAGQAGWDSMVASFRVIRGASFGKRYGNGVTTASQLVSCLRQNKESKNVPLSAITGSAITTDKLRDSLAHGQTIVPLVKLKSSTHWIAVTGWYKNGNSVIYRIADPWPKDGKPQTNYVSSVTSREDAFYSDKISESELMSIIKADIIYSWHNTAHAVVIGNYR